MKVGRRLEIGKRYPIVVVPGRGLAPEYAGSIHMSMANAYHLSLIRRYMLDIVTP